MKPAPQSEMLAIESEPPGAEAKTSLGQSCRTPCQLAVQPGSEFSVTLALSGYQLQTVSVRPEVQGAGAAPRFAPNPVHVTLQAVTPPKKPIAKKKKPVVAAARPAASLPVASASPHAGACSKGCAYYPAPQARRRRRHPPPTIHGRRDNRKTRRIASAVETGGRVTDRCRPQSRFLHCQPWTGAARVPAR